MEWELGWAIARVAFGSGLGCRLLRRRRALVMIEGRTVHVVHAASPDHCVVRVGMRVWQCEISGLAVGGWALLRCLLGRLGAHVRRSALWAGGGWSMACPGRCARMSRI